VIAPRTRLRPPVGAAMRLALTLACVAGLVSPTAVHAQGDALTLTEILKLRRRGVSNRQVLRAAQEYCVAFTVTDSIERALLAVGADTGLLTGLRRSCVSMSPSVQLAPGVLVDDNFTTMSGLRAFTATDRLCTASPIGRGLQVENRRGRLGCAIDYPLEVGDTAVRVELTVAEVQGKPAAMVALGFGKDRDSWDQYSFGITNENLFELCVSVGGRCQRLLFQRRMNPLWTERSPETRLAVEIRGRELSLFIDDQRVGTYSAPKVVVGNISLGVGPRTTAVFSRLRVKRLDGLATFGPEVAGTNGPAAGSWGAHASTRTGLPRAFRAVRLSAAPPIVDGVLEDPAWRSADSTGGFVQYQPRAGAPATERTVVRVLYGGGAMYVAARLYDRRADSITARLGERDEEVFSDRFYVYLDSYFDRRSAFAFAVNPAGVKWDAVLSQDTEIDQDWDAVWDAAARVDAKGWTVEMRIPLSQLRFHVGPSGTGEQRWGVNFRRWIARRDELSDWAPIPRNAGRFVSSFGELRGLRDFAPPRRLELQPYSVARLTRAPGAPNDPFYRPNDLRSSVGTDLKYRFAPNVTLTATLNPDFGQVEADRSVVYRGGDYEHFFPEKRPFFLEGSNIFAFDARGARVIHSRNIGEVPRQTTAPPGGFVYAPSATTILGAAKLTGQTKQQWSFGLMEAVTAPEEARIADAAGTERVLPVAPLTNFAAGRVTKQMRRGASAVGAIATAVNRRLDDPAFDTLASAGYVAGLDARHRFRKHYEVRAMLLRSHVEGTQVAIRRLQRRHERYFQRPDASHLRYDSTRTSLTGISGGVSLVGFVDHWNWEVGAHARSPGFELNDLGFLPDADAATQYVFLEYDQYNPGRLFRRWTLGFNQSSRWSFGGERLSHFFGLDARFELPSYWGLYLGASRQLSALHTRMLGGGPALLVPGQTGGYVGLWTDTRRRVRGDLTARAARDDENGGRWLSLSSSLYIRPSRGFELVLTPSYSAYEVPWQSVGAPRVAGQPVYLVGRLEQTTASLTTRLSLAFSPTLSLRLYSQPFASAFAYGEFKEVLDPHAPAFADRFHTYAPGEIAYDGSARVYRVDRDANGRPDVAFGNPNFDFAEIRSQAVLAWEYRRGSTLFLVWRQDRSRWGTEGRLDVESDAARLLGISPDYRIPSKHEVVVKLSYWLGR
jgi:hypothetical protein